MKKKRRNKVGTMREKQVSKSKWSLLAGDQSLRYVPEYEVRLKRRSAFSFKKDLAQFSCLCPDSDCPACSSNDDAAVRSKGFGFRLWMRKRRVWVNGEIKELWTSFTTPCTDTRVLSVMEELLGE